jgi:hypothetical protein
MFEKMFKSDRDYYKLIHNRIEKNFIKEDKQDLRKIIRSFSELVSNIRTGAMESKYLKQLKKELIKRKENENKNNPEKNEETKGTKEIENNLGGKPEIIEKKDEGTKEIENKLGNKPEIIEEKEKKVISKLIIQKYLQNKQNYGNYRKKINEIIDNEHSNIFLNIIEMIPSKEERLNIENKFKNNLPEEYLLEIPNIYEEESEFSKLLKNEINLLKTFYFFATINKNETYTKKINEMIKDITIDIREYGNNNDITQKERDLWEKVMDLKKETNKKVREYNNK